MIDHTLLQSGDIPLRTKVESEEFYQALDPGIRFAVRVLHAHGIETGQSCQGGEGHAYDRPSVDLRDEPFDNAEGFAAVASLIEFGLPVRDVSMVWSIDRSGLPWNRLWRITFSKTMEDRADDPLMFLWGYQAQRMAEDTK